MTGALVHNIIALSVGGAVCLIGVGVSIYAYCSKKKEEEARKPLLVDFVY